MAVVGIEEFADFFSGYEDCYTIIGGAACEILLSEVPGGFRATRDIDMQNVKTMQEGAAT